MSVKKRIAAAVLAAVVLLAVFILGSYFGYSQRPAVEKAVSFINKEEGRPAQVDFSPFWKAWLLLESKYVDNEKIDEQKMVWGAISGLASSFGDPYTIFFPPEEKKLFESEIRGDFEGVGMEIGMRGGILTVIAPLKGTPAERAGIESGDKILEIDDKSTAGLGVDKAVRLIRGPKGTEVKLTISREAVEEPFAVSVMREVINIPVYDTEKKEGGVFVIKLYNFSEKSPYVFRTALREMIESGSDKLILDLRGNAGGYLEASVDIASWFLPVGKVVAREKFSSGEEKLYRSRGYDIFNERLKMVILVDKGSASASEILAGALKEHGKAVLVGEKTFGKGSVQELVPVTEDTSLKITIARWLTPQGRSISEEGLEPDYEVRPTKEEEEKGRDPQMEKALEIMMQIYE